MGGRELLAAILLCGAAATASFAAERQTAPRVSANARYEIVFHQTDDGRCRVEVWRDKQRAWALEKCVGTVDDLYFVSNHGDVFWVLYPVPEKPRGAPWFKAVVARQYDRTGKLLGGRRLSDLIPRYERSKVQQLTRHFKWLEGTAGVTGKPPRVTPENLVELETVQPKTHRLKFQSRPE